jgi:hypothetical protein
VIRTLGVAGDIEIGRRLVECKRIAGHGGWLPWLDRELGWDERTVRRSMSVYEMMEGVGKSDTVSDLEIPCGAFTFSPLHPRVVRRKRGELWDERKIYSSGSNTRGPRK